MHHCKRRHVVALGVWLTLGCGTELRDEGESAQASGSAESSHADSTSRGSESPGSHDESTGGTHESSSSSSDGSSSGDGPVTADCDTPAEGPLELTERLHGLTGSRAVAFDGAGNLAAKASGDLALFSAVGQPTVLVEGFEQLLSLARASDGTWLAGGLDSRALVRIAANGDRTTLIPESYPLNVHVDGSGTTWIAGTREGFPSIVVLDDQGSVSWRTPPPAGDVIRAVTADEPRGRVLFARGDGTVQAIPANGAPDAESTLVATVSSAITSLAMDDCGHLYLVDGDAATLLRVRLDALGTAVGVPETLVEFPEPVTTAVFGAGQGFSSTAVYVIGTPGTLFEVELGVGGA